jgi:hypothetical protein
MMSLIALAFAWLAVNYVPFIIFYVVGGTVYSVLKWIIQLYRLASKVKAISSDTEYPDTVKSSITSDLFWSSSYPPTAAENKSLLMTWALFWPFNLIYTLFADVTREAWNFLYRKFGAILDVIAKKILPN